MKKQSNPPPPYDNPKHAVVNITQAEMVDVFNEWNRRYAENPEEFKDAIGKDGKPLSDYGQECCHYFIRILNEMRVQRVAK